MCRDVNKEQLIGDGELYRLFFRWNSSKAKVTRRQRIRLLTRLNRLTEANPIDLFSERGSPGHTELIIAAQHIKVIAVLMATGNREHPRSRHVAVAVPDTPAVAIVRNVPAEHRGETEPFAP